MISGINSNINTIELYKLAQKTNNVASKAQKTVDNSMTMNGSIYNAKPISNYNNSVSSIETKLNSLKTSNLDKNQKKQISSIETQLNEIKSKSTAVSTNSTAATTSVSQTNTVSSLNRVKTSSNKYINTLSSPSSKTLYQRGKNTVNIGKIAKNTGRQMQNNPYTSSSGKALEQVSIDDILDEYSNDNVNYFIDNETGKKYRVSIISCIQGTYQMMMNNKNHQINLNKLYSTRYI